MPPSTPAAWTGWCVPVLDVVDADEYRVHVIDALLLAMDAIGNSFNELRLQVFNITNFVLMEWSYQNI